MRPHHQAPPSSSGNDWKVIASLFPFLWEHKNRVLLALACIVIAKVANVGVPLALKEIVDSLDPSLNAVVVLPAAALIAYGVLRLSTALFGELRDAIFAKVTQHSIRRTSLQVFRHLHSLSLRFHLDRKTGGVSRDIERGAKGISFLLTFTLFNILPTLIEIVLVASILLVAYDPIYALITFATVAIYIVFTLVVTEWRMPFRRTMNEKDSNANTRAIDSLLNYETVKYFNNEAWEAKRYDENLQSWEHAAIKSQTSLAVLNIGQAAVIAIGITLLLSVAAQQVSDGILTIGDLVLINAFLLQLFIPMNFLGFVYREIRHSLADIEKMFKLTEVDAEVVDKTDAPALQIERGVVRFEHVDFSYDADRSILHDVNFEIPAGKTVAVVGSSGAGKSTLARLLFRFYDASKGRILIDGQDISGVTQHSLRSAIGIVPQDTVLFNDTIYYNIAYAKQDASCDEVIRAAELAHLHSFISALPNGYETTVGERGLKLSGGEKQRVAIARTILKNPHILIFDEATSALDSASEQAIQKALGEVAATRTTLVIAHRLSTIVDAQRILVMEHGRIIEQGRHDELLAAQGSYARMWALQQKEQHSGE
ncbi:MAG: ABC transporter ATP-binding protein/permease [Gammaproteobacteria bacterium]|nr:ABC transporter ATP-binding protein/permease [Gammaproteobacteria bacterium]